MAEGLFRALVKNSPDYAIQSAGISAAKGQKASQHTLDVLKRACGIDLNRFRSQPLTNPPKPGRRAPDFGVGAGWCMS